MKAPAGAIIRYAVAARRRPGPGLRRVVRPTRAPAVVVVRTLVTAARARRSGRRLEPGPVLHLVRLLGAPLLRRPLADRGRRRAVAPAAEQLLLRRRVAIEVDLRREEVLQPDLRARGVQL